MARPDASVVLNVEPEELQVLTDLVERTTIEVQPWMKIDQTYRVEWNPHTEIWEVVPF